LLLNWASLIPGSLLGLELIELFPELDLRFLNDLIGRFEIHHQRQNVCIQPAVALREQTDKYFRALVLLAWTGRDLTGHLRFPRKKPSAVSICK